MKYIWQDCPVMVAMSPAGAICSFHDPFALLFILFPIISVPSSLTIPFTQACSHNSKPSIVTFYFASFSLDSNLTTNSIIKRLAKKAQELTVF